MNQVIVSDPLGTELSSLVEPVAVVDVTGRKLGHFVPSVSQTSAECPYSAEELRAMRAEEGGRSLEEIWRCLQ